MSTSALPARRSGKGWKENFYHGFLLGLLSFQTDWLVACRRALGQEEEKGYAAQLREDGMETILTYGIACNRKRCRMLVENAYKYFG